MLGLVLVILGTLAVCPLSQGQESVQEKADSSLNLKPDEAIQEKEGKIFSLNQETDAASGSKVVEMGTSLTQKDFENGEKLKNIPSKEDAKKQMHLVLQNKPENEKRQILPGKDRSVQREVKYRWPNGVVPYKIETVFTDEEKAVIASAIMNIQENSCVTFRPAIPSDLDFVYIFTTDASGCTGHKFLGPSYGEHHLNLEGDSGDGLTCIDRGVIIHELMHMLGFNHEQQRPDRDTMVTVNWPAIEVDKIHNHFRDSWDTEDLTVVPICNSTGADQATADFSGCVSGEVVTAYGVEYDFYSVMHYEFDAFAVDSSVPSMVPFDNSVTSPGNVELSPLDILKLQKAYGCSGCGGYKKSSTGGSITGSGSDFLCEWVLESDNGKGIRIDISEMTPTGSDCSSDYLEVRLGKSSDDPLVGKYCSSDLPTEVKVDSSTAWIKWVKSDDSSSISATWSVYDVVCCQTVMLENMTNLPTVTFQMTEEMLNGRPLYKLTEGLSQIFYLFWYPSYGWYVGEDPNTTFIVAANAGQNICPESTTVTWEYAKEEGLVGDPGGKLRCSDCIIYPEFPECEECCDRVTLQSTFTELNDPTQYYSQFLGEFSYSGVDHNSHKVYQSDRFSTACLFYSNTGNWITNACSDLDTTSRWFTAPGTKCVHQTTSWVIFSQNTGEDVEDNSLSLTCPEECCDTLTLSSTFNELNDPTQYYSQFMGQFSYSGVNHNSHKVYQSDIFNIICLFYNNLGNWVIHFCEDLNTTNRLLKAPGTGCADQSSGWIIYSQISQQDVPDASLTFTCPETTSTPKLSSIQTSEESKLPTTRPRPATTKLSLTNSITTATGCLPCKNVEDGPLKGSYILQEMKTTDSRCLDGCVYSKEDDLYCFALGDDIVKECN